MIELTPEQFISLFTWITINAMLCAALLGLSHKPKEKDYFRKERESIQELLSYARTHARRREGA